MYLAEHEIRSPYIEMFWDQYPYALAYFYNFFMATSKFVLTSQFVTHLWSLAVEEQFYIVWPLVIFLTPTRHLKKVFLASIGLAAFAFGALITIGISLSKAKGQFLFLLAALPALSMLTDYLTTGQWNANNGFGLLLLLSNAYKPVWGYSILNYLFMLLIYGVAKEDWLTRPLEHPWMRYLGKISYGLYVYHYAILWTITDLKDRWFTFKPADKSAQNL